jgi:hypothetical protein
MMEARKVMPNMIVLVITTPFSEYLETAPPTKNLKIKDVAPKVPISMPISLSSEPKEEK